MPIVHFPAIIERGARPGYSVFFPDLPGCTSAGATMQEAARNAEMALRLHLRGMIEDGERLPRPTELDALATDPEVDEAARVLVRGEVPGRAVRLNISMDEGLVAAVDATAGGRGMTRSALLAEAVHRLIESDAPARPKGRRRSRRR